ncbi:MAG: hypothetical protein IPL28_06115 [Chloroflexi bacterium]|nr:hypothetical protein [Chloroflexota bacterium]
MIKRITLFLALALFAFAPFGRARADAFFIGTALQPARVGDRLGDNQVENTMCVMADSVQTIFDEAHETNSIPCGLIEFPLPDLVIGNWNCSPRGKQTHIAK